MWSCSPANQGRPLAARIAPPGLVAALLRSAEFGRVADAVQARASPASLTDGEVAVGISRASAQRTSSTIAGVFTRRRGRRRDRTRCARWNSVAQPPTT